jgi:hypothetical protein
VWTIKKQFVHKLALPGDETLNYGIYLPKAGVYLEEQRTLASYYFSDNVIIIIIIILSRHALGAVEPASRLGLTWI